MKSNSPLSPLLLELKKQGHCSDKFLAIVTSFFEIYENVIDWGKVDKAHLLEVIHKYLQELDRQFVSPYIFEPYHQKVKKPFSYWQLGLDFMRPLVDLPHSTLEGISTLERMQNHLKQKGNVVLFANHQIEADPQMIGLLLETSFASLADQMIFVAGERVVTDPLAIPLSMGCNLLCIYSKKYIDHPIELKEKKQQHNKKTMQLMSDLLKEGGKCIYVAPSGGRDRKNQEGKVVCSPFDMQSIEMFHLMAKRSQTPTLYVPLALATYNILPPPDETQKELGELRLTKGGAIHMHFCPEVDLDAVDNLELDKLQKRERKTQLLFDAVEAAYNRFPLNY